MSENMFLDVIADVNSDYVEEVLFMPQIEQDSEDLQKYRKKSNVGKIFGTAAACVAIIGVGVAAILLNKSGFFTEPAQNTETITTTEDESDKTSAAETDETQTTPEETQASEKKVYVYGEVEIPDIPGGTGDVDGFSGVEGVFDESSCLDRMVFETHTVGEYVISLVGDSVRVDKENFPGSIYAQDLRVEVEKNGVKVPDKAFYNDFLTYVGQCREFRLFADKIGTYIDLYELEQPVIAMRYYYDDNPARLVTKAVQFGILQNYEICTGFAGVSEKHTGVAMNPGYDDTLPINYWWLVPSYENNMPCIVSMFEAEEFKITDTHTLVDEEAEIKYTFDFFDPNKFEQYTTEKIRTTPTPECFNSLEGIPGDVVASDITWYDCSSENPDIWSVVECEGFAYMADFTESPTNYKRYYVGDKIGYLTVTKAETDFINMSEENVSDMCRKNMSVILEGETMLTGVYYIREESDPSNPDYYNVYFYPDEESRKKLPLFCGFNGFTGTENIDESGLYPNFKYYDEQPVINFGYKIDFKDFERDKPIKGRATIAELNYNFTMGTPEDSWCEGWLRYYKIFE